MQKEANQGVNFTAIIFTLMLFYPFLHVGHSPHCFSLFLWLAHSSCWHWNKMIGSCNTAEEPSPITPEDARCLQLSFSFDGGPVLCASAHHQWRAMPILTELKPLSVSSILAFLSVKGQIWRNKNTYYEQITDVYLKKCKSRWLFLIIQIEKHTNCACKVQL